MKCPICENYYEYSSHAFYIVYTGKDNKERKKVCTKCYEEMQGVKCQDAKPY